MKNILLFSFLYFISFLNSTYSQNLEFNLKSLDNISVEVSDDQQLLSNKIYHKIITEVKLKLISSGMKVSNADEATAHLLIIVDAIKSRLAEDRILVLLNVSETVTTKRTGGTVTEAITYLDYSFFKAALIEEAVYNKVMDEMIINFMENYLNQK